MQIVAPPYDPSAKQPRPYVRFEVRPVEDRAASIKAGQTVYVDQYWVVVSAPGSRDTMEKLVHDWLANLRINAKDERIPPTWPEEYANAFEHWKKTQEMPIQGTPIKTWPPLSPSQRENVLGANVLTVEDLAGANESTLSRIGMGALNLKKMAQTWLTEASGPGAQARQLEALLVQNETQTRQIEALTRQVEELKANATVLKKA